MAEIVNMPRLSDTMEEGTVAKWLKKVGDKIEEGDILAEIETDKATMEFESFHEGTLLHIGIAEGDGAPVDSLLAIIGEEGEDISALLDGGSEKSDSAENPDEKSDTAQVEVDTQGSSSTESSGEIPEGVEVVKMPRLSDTMEEGTVATWLKKVGDDVEEGDILAEIETDKATMEFESFYSGKLLYIGIKEGESAPVDDVLAVIGPEGTDIDAVLNTKPSAGKQTESQPQDSGKSDSGSENQEKSESPAPAKRQDGERIFVSPLARKMAEEKGIDLNAVNGSGDNGRIVKRDIENFTPAADKTEAAPAAAAMQAPASKPVILPVGEEGSEESKNSQMRKVIAKRLSESKFTAPHYYLTIEVDMANAAKSRVYINDLPDTKVSFNDLVVKACALALQKHPQVNTSWNGDTTRFNKHIHVGVAVAVEDGLVVPVLKFADQMSLTQIGSAVKDLAGRARIKKLTPAEMEGSTFTVSNLGMFGILEFTSIINQPNSAILSVGAIVEKPVVKNGEIVVGKTMKLTLACDHRTVDGATGAQFLQTLRAYIENPVTMLA
ncbi:pyruvate dehydrogenase complex dihydrolipoamide acetyltransferase [Muriicola soli]|uniref:Acetyltransferase component of pyruvate dehydrogenase complex n=1 Tax=Muriicola soli TaxID=2507538 RepID=A0A411EAZ7_9FLAO|nr:pyruvate dehydrogenase complex dihydrolipoamide acetyltransferase [Muriicola soli]QBA64906.1 pyruvate dehydrogenase complex dihydrolipoamide acetyltransferase [Muriicola soli]